MPIKTPCAGRKKQNACVQEKVVNNASGKTRKYCRKSRNTRRSRK